MNGLPLHPSIVHVPLGLAVAMPLLTLVLLVGWLGGWMPRRAWWTAVGLQALLMASGVAALRSGEAEEERVEDVVPEQAIEAHEEKAEAFVIASGLVLVVLLGAALLPAERPARALAGLGAVGTVVVLGLGYAVGHAGGELVWVHGAGKVGVAASATQTGVHAPGGGWGEGDEGEDDDD